MFFTTNEPPNVPATDGLSEQERTGYAAQEIHAMGLTAQGAIVWHELHGRDFPVNADHTTVYDFYA